MKTVLLPSEQKRAHFSFLAPLLLLFFLALLKIKISGKTLML